MLSSLFITVKILQTVMTFKHKEGELTHKVINMWN